MSFFFKIDSKKLDQRKKFESYIGTIKQSLNDENCFVRMCQGLYELMCQYKETRTKGKSKFINWFDHIIQPTNKNSCLSFLKSIVKNGIPSSASAWGYGELNQVRCILKNLETSNIKFDVDSSDFDSDKLGFYGTIRRWRRASYEWNTIKNSDIYAKIYEIKDVANMIKYLPNCWKNKNNANSDFEEAAEVLISAYATFIRDQFIRIRKPYLIFDKLSIKDPTKFNKSKKFKIISLLINYIFEYTIAETKNNVKDISITYAGTHGVFIEVILNNETKKYFKITDLDEVDNIEDFVRYSGIDNKKLSNKQRDLNKVHNMSMYESVHLPKQKEAKNKIRTAVLGTKYHANRKIDSVVDLYIVALDVCEFFIDLHSLGYVHGDIKEDNIRLTDDGVIVIDIDGIQEAGWGYRTGTPSNNKWTNTLRYLNPIKYLNIRHFGKIWIDQTDDLYSFGAMMQRLIESYSRKYSGQIRDEDRSLLESLKKIATKCKNPGPIKYDQNGKPIAIAKDIYCDIQNVCLEHMNIKNKETIANHISKHSNLRNETKLNIMQKLKP